VDGNDSVLLDAGALPDNPVYLWNDDFGEPSRHVSHSGTYILTVTNQYACKDVDTVDVTIKQNPVVSLGNDTNVCLGAAVLLDAKNPGNNHLWNTGAMVQQITAQSPGSYSVKVTTPENCFKSDTITVTMNGQFPVVDDIIITNNGNSTFTFTPYNPRHVMAYDWNFGDGTPNSNEQAPIHTYAIPGNYEVTLLLQSVCGSKTYTRSSNIVGIEQLNIAKEELLLSPNPAYGNTTIVNRGAFKMEQIEMYGIDGRLIYNEKADGAALHYLIQNIYRAEYL
jgi:PKD repeat protein